MIDPIELPRTHWIEKALASVMSLTPGQVVCARGAAWGAGPMRGGMPRSNYYSTGPHAHPFVEICIALEGEAVLDLAGGRYRMSPPTVAVIEPGVSHCEARRRHDRNYALMWLGGAGPSLSTNVMTWQRSRGWKGRHVLVLRSVQARRLLERFLGDDPWMRPAWFEAVRRDLLATLSDLYIQSSDAARLPAPSSAADRHRPALEHVKAMLDEQAVAPLPVPRLAEIVGLSPNYLNTLFAQWQGESIHAYQQRRRLDAAMALLREGGLMVKQVASRLGYRDPFYFSRSFRKQFGVWPSEVR